MILASRVHRVSVARREYRVHRVQEDMRALMQTHLTAGLLVLYIYHTPLPHHRLDLVAHGLRLGECSPTSTLALVPVVRIPSLLLRETCHVGQVVTSKAVMVLRKQVHSRTG